MAEQQQNGTTTIPRPNAIDNDYDLSLSLGLFDPINGHIIMQDSLKRKAPSPNGDVVRNEQGDEEGASERRCKVMNSGLTPRSLQGQNGNLVGNNGGGGEIRSSVSTGSSSHTYHSNSNAGESGSDTSSQSSHFRVHLPAATAPASDPSENQPVSSQEESHLNYSNQSQCSRNVTLTDINRQPRKSQSDSNKRALDKGSSPTPPRSSSLKEPKVAIGKPPKPKRQKSQHSVLLPQMPCVSTDGSNGKTITGFLYKYSKTEVSIICVCHGASFSPAGFVEHAGAVDVEHPLKHIRVVPFALS